MSQRPYTISATTDLSPEDAEARIRETLAEQGFGILSEVNMSATLKTKLDLDHPFCKILGACNPPLAAKALAIDPAMGALLPCHVTIYRDGDETVVAAIEPVAAMGTTGNADLEPIALDVRDRLTRAIAAL
ncbi:MAG: DUF302 domain-containing protein [Actinomycetia bacterium]|nr:DUF302 domain-containing protein [Actinomycetes bacterium]